MSNRSISMTDDLYAYLLENSSRESVLLKDLREVTAQLPEANMQIAPEQGQFMRMLVRLIGAKRAIEVGTFTGYSSICIAQGMEGQGQLICCDINEEWTNIARPYWMQAGVLQNINLQIGPATKTLDALLDADQAGQFDFAFIDADKVAYRDYFERLIKLVRVGGLIVIDNVLWDGKVLDEDDTSDDTFAIRRFNAHLVKDDRVEISMLPIADGLTLARRAR